VSRPDRFPRVTHRNLPRGSLLLAWFARCLLWLGRWRIEGEVPDLAKAVVIGAPHTSRWDVILAVLVGMALRVRFHFLVADDLTWPKTWLACRFGGIPVRSKQAAGGVAAGVAAFRDRDQLVLVVAPEGRLKRARTWRTGFYHLARQAEVPIVMGAVDYRTRTVRLDAPWHPSADRDAALARVTAFYRPVAPRNPDRWAPPTFE
jgi:1-acyl-sn-glycerol-3-phosphate acyltransferase